MQTRKASIKETGEELAPADWERFDTAVAKLKAERRRGDAETAPCDEQQNPKDRDGQAVP